MSAGNSPKAKFEVEVAFFRAATRCMARSVNFILFSRRTQHPSQIVALYAMAGLLAESECPLPTTGVECSELLKECQGDD